MADTTIEWTSKVWNCLRGCSRLSEGCRNCYAERMAARFSGSGQPYEGLVRASIGGPRWTGVVRFIPEKLGEPLGWRKPARVFVNSMSDLFHEDVTNEQIAAVFGVMAACPQHTFQILTKRPARMRQWFEWVRTAERGRWDGTVIHYAERILGGSISPSIPGVPLPNVHLLVSVEDQRSADERIPLLLDTPAAVRGVSLEPMIGQVDLKHLDADAAGHPTMCQVDALTGRHTDMGRPCAPVAHLDWVIVGGESGPGARPMAPEWPRSIRDQCDGAGVAFFFKQWGGVQKKKAGRVLDGRTHDGMPGVRA